MSCTSAVKRNIDGIVLLDKPIGISSNNLLQNVKRLFRAKKAGHTGSLDPLATGMLPICLGEATKFSHYLLEANKRYLVTAKLGERTNTSDSEGKTVSIRDVLVDQDQLETALNQFRGKSRQVPSMFSALKHKGRPLYEYARKGITVKREARSINVYDLKLHDWNVKELELEIHCSKGTYIRTIIDDLGELLGCGAHVIALRRLSISSYPAELMVTLATLKAISEDLKQLDALILPINSAIEDIPSVNLSSDIASLIRLGKTVSVITQRKAGLVRLTEGVTEHFFGIGEIVSPGMITPRRLIVEYR